MHLRQLVLTAVLCLLCSGRAVLTSAQLPSFSAIAPAMQAFVDRGEIAGVVTLVATKDRVLHIAAIGQSDLTSGRSMRTDDVFWIASMSKPVTAAAIAILVDEGRLAFDDPIEKYLPEFKGIAVVENGQSLPPSRPITLRDVLTHTSGVGEIPDRAPHLTLAETSEALAKTALRFQPGTRWSYSTSGIEILGRVVEVVSGQAFDTFLNERIFMPLGMKDTTFWITPETLPRWARSYQWVAAESRLRERAIPFMYGTEVTDWQRAPLGGAGLFSTAEDMARFYRMTLNQGVLDGRRVLSASTVAEMTRKQTSELRARAGMPWGLGFCVVEDPQAMEANQVLSPGSFGHGGAYSTQSWADPVRGLVWIVMFERTGKGNPDNSDVRIAFQRAALPDLPR